MEIFKVSLGRALSSLIWVRMSLPMAESLDWATLNGPFHPKAFYDALFQKPPKNTEAL